MAKDRPWNQAAYTQSPKPEGLDLDAASDDEVRSYCLRRARAFLVRAEAEDSAINSRHQLEIASQYAMIAQAFREDPGQD
ncbi:hypothetical protein FHS35_007613 [Streptomyces umbrinus]|uniref:Uncharacterized protein n=1 Tax=Streptomyces scabichelini TaxID=2711217 RepID=A0A6G4V653_9ACTN|nr:MULTISPECIES: hypothetical protein [Streptomyces]MCR3730720.1 hypothetical protein [Streptomyces umbrinus]NGO09313.1 hypothetical protein [Streptomyces scabichelini]GHH38199.1 hypothetical protein GCM10018775_16380 [Streptomyces umbrinus]